MKLKAINAIYRKEKGKQVRVEPGEQFDCPDEEGQFYLDQKAAFEPEPVKEAKKAAPAKPAKAAPAKAAKAPKAAAPAAKAAAPATLDETAGGANDENLLGD